MADIGTFRPFIVVVTFLGVLVLLMGLIPTEFYTAGEEREVATPESWESSNLPQLDYAEAQNRILNWTLMYDEIFQIGNRWVQFQWYLLPSAHVKLWHRFGYWLPWLGYPGQYAEFDWYQNGILHSDNEISITTINSDYALGGLNNLRYTLRQGEVQLDAAFVFNEDAYDTPLEAWQDDALVLWFGIEWDFVGTAFNAWDLISLLLFFKLPGVHPVLNMILAIPIWSAVAILAFTFVTAIIPFIRGL